ncbi:MAG: hypothetical protein QUU85_07025, partial [Candidatus Eisenbacteria bacterium]|nr:hypothetical protein [Candidatus Eisenbacteria bacterium]
MSRREFDEEGPGRVSGTSQNEAQDEALGRRAGLKFRRYFTKAGIDPFDTVSWDMRTAVITNESGDVIFEQTGV